MRQDDDAAHHRRARARERGRRRHRRQAHERPQARTARHRDGVPVLRALSGADRAREHHVPAASSSGSRRKPPSRAGRAGRAHAPARTVLDRLPNQISEGEKQRVAVARAVVRDPNCFLFDEPLSRLDVELRQTMRGQIKSVLTGLSKATVIVTHDQLEALTMADRIAIMRDGVIEQIASPHEVFARPANAVRRELHRHAADESCCTRNSRASRAAGAVRDRWPADPPRRRPGGAKLPKGQVTIGIRPARASSRSRPACADTIAGRAELIEPMGAETLDPRAHARAATTSASSCRAKSRSSRARRSTCSTDARADPCFRRSTERRCAHERRDRDCRQSRAAA